MYITRRNDGGMFLALFTHNQGLMEEEANPPVLGPPIPYWLGRHSYKDSSDRQRCSCAGEAYYYAKYCPAHQSSWVEPSVDMHKLYAFVGRVTLKQLGQFMMGNIRIGNTWLTVSGTYGSDGNSMDYEKVPVKYRHHLVEVPPAIADQFWAGEGGWNSAGSEGPVMHKYGMSLLRDLIGKDAVAKR